MARLVRVGFPRSRAHTIARRWERLIHPLLYPPVYTLSSARVPAPLRLPLRAPRRYE